MELSFIYFIELLCVVMPLVSSSDIIMRGFWITFWSSIISYITFDPSAPDPFTLFNSSMAFEIITYYSLISSTIFLILGIFYWPRFSYYYDASKTAELLFIQFTSMLYQINYFSELSFFRKEFYYIINILPLICCYLNILAYSYLKENFKTMLFFWSIGNILIYFDLVFSPFMSILWLWIILPLIETFFMIIMCISYCTIVYDIINCLQLKNLKNKNFNILSIIYVFPMIKNLIKILSIIGVKICIEYIMIFLYGYIPILVSIAFTLTYGYTLNLLLSCFNVYDIHKCFPIKLLSLNYISLIFSIYVFKIYF